jgi:hypothetical protein
MADRLSESDLDRIAEFTNTPRYKRSPDQLIPDGGTEEEERSEPSDGQTA